ncbi:aldo/keto reductase [Natranaeroarchaeum sulfidigenes]|uniref:Aryl-alcohol dehydrogenase related enzyme n=1 Tax=Natranaeroarchaeum sulfidigenes TaxID=2784880 RepID=A0A897MPE4_9EURY|nr:aldo/keto reductase [Natranaeroarchaeum sulfidigenes]QSG02427.1 Aryl-alcohol dehydrogenase related enzyme [Natranaeroarchaeum sulfidigenes]
MASANQSDTFEIGGDLTVHRLGFGAMRLTGEHVTGEPDDVENARDVLRRAIDLGVDFIDTADSYGPSVSERLIGETLMTDPEYRDEVVVATKGGLIRQVDEGFEWARHGHPGYLQHAAYTSRDRLRVDQIDLYQLHRVDPEYPMADQLHALAELKDEGVIGHIGLSNVSVDQLEAAREIVDVATVQNQYNVANREHEDVLQACENYGIGFMPYSPIASGELGEYADLLDDIAGTHDATRYQIALAWLLERSENLLPIPGTSSLEHLEANIAASTIELSDEELARLDDK